ncbi:MAG: hypothetical protein ACLUTO_03655 [Anaerostipes sp.]
MCRMKENRIANHEELADVVNYCVLTADAFGELLDPDETEPRED